MIAGLENGNDGEAFLIDDERNKNKCFLPPKRGDRDGIPVVCALSAHVGVRESGVRPSNPRGSEVRNQDQGRHGGEGSADRSLAAAKTKAAFRRTAAGAVAIGRAIVRDPRIFLFDETLVEP